MSEEICPLQICDVTRLHYNLPILNMQMIEICAKNILTLQTCHTYDQSYYKRCQIVFHKLLN